MDILAQRELGLRLAKSLSASGAGAVIGDKDSNYGAIFTAAAAEVDRADLIKAIVSGPPEWSCEALQCVPDLCDADRAALAARAADDSFSAVRALRLMPDNAALAAAAGVFAANQGTISGFYLNNKGSYNCEYTMYWVDNGQFQPQTGYPDSDNYKWSDKLMVGQDQKLACTWFAQPKAPLKEGDTVWIYLWVQAGQDVNSPLRFTYSSTVADYAWFTSSGCTQSDSLALDKIAPPPS